MKLNPTRLNASTNESFPLRERGLKLRHVWHILHATPVVPLAGTWIETLTNISQRTTTILSFPLRERGLKHLDPVVDLPDPVVVPLAGTWIETNPGTLCTGIILVVPLAGTWIETKSEISSQRTDGVVPLAGTWIETAYIYFHLQYQSASFPLRERGLKLSPAYMSKSCAESFPLRERGLKLVTW